jgi:hypothetical protein
MSTRTHPETTLQRPGQDVLIPPEARQRGLSIRCEAHTDHRFKILDGIRRVVAE